MCHVLIIEDESLVAMDLQSILADQGATSFDIAETEDEAVALAITRRPDVITSDVKLRDGTGPRAVETILGRLGPVPVLFITGTPEECEPCQGAHVLSKPIQNEAVSSAFRELAAA